MKIYDVRGIGASLTGSFSGSFKGLFTGPLDGVAATSSYVQYSNVANKPALVSGSSQITYSGISSKPAGIVSGSSQVLGFNVFATTGSNGFNGNQSITGSLTVTGQVIAQTLNVQQVTSSIVFSSGSNRFGNNSGNTHSFTGSVNITGSITVNGSGLVPYTGATQEVNLGVYSISAGSLLTNQITVNPSGTTAAQVFLKHGSSFSLPNGFGSIGSSTGNEFRLYQVSSGGVWRAANISLNSITSSATRTYTLPDSDGTIALTSALSDYVTIATTQTITGAKTFNTTTSEFAGFNSTNASGGVLTFRRSGTNVGHIGNSAQLGGGVLDAIEVRSGTGSSVILKTDGGALTLATGGGVTLTGALNGTSASFTGAVTINGDLNFNSAGGTTFLNINQGAGADGGIIIKRTNVNRWQIAQTTSGDNLNFYSYGNSSDVLRLNYSTGAATFSSSVTARNGTSGVAFQTTNAVNADFTIETTSGGLTKIGTSGNILGINVGGGNVGIGTASPNFFGYGSGVTVLSLAATASDRYSAIELVGNRGIGENQNGNIDFVNNNGTATVTSRITALNGASSVLDGILTFHTRTSASALTERMRITSGGYTKARANGGNYFGGGYHEFVNNNNVSGDNCLAIGNVAGSNTNNTSSKHLIVADSAADRLYIYGNGNVVNVNNSYGSLSDIKLKENIEDATPKLDDLMKVRIRNYNLIGEETKQIGVIAQELEEVFPAMIDDSEDFEYIEVPQLDEEGNEVLNEEGEVVTEKQRISKGTTTKSVKYSVFVPMLIKAIQELKTEIDSLKNQIK